MQQGKLSPSFLISVALHIVVLLMLIASFEFSSQTVVVENSDQNMKIINAVAMNVPPVSNPAPPTPAPLPPKPVEAKPLPPAPPPPPPKPQVKAAEPLPKPVVDVQKQKAIALKEARKKQLAEQKADLEKQLLADLKKQTKQNNKKAAQKSLEQAMEKEMQDVAAKSLQQQLLHAQQHAAGAKVRGIVDKYKALILEAISQRWLVPPGTDKNLYAELFIHLAPGGAVLDVQVTKSSGLAAFDRSAKDAVFKASPLPVPNETVAFDQFRQFVLKVKPNNIIAADG